MAVGELYRALWRRKLVIAAATLLVVAASAFQTTRQQKTYSATSLVRIQQTIANSTDAFGALQTGGRLAQTYARIAGTTTIAEKVYDALDGRVPLPEIAGSITGAQVEDLELLSITATSTTPARAKLIADAAPEALRRFIADTGTLRDEVVTIEPAALPRGPASPSLRLNIAAALVLGFVLGAALALLIELVADRAHDAEELELLTRRPVLSSVANLDLVRIGELGFKVPPRVVPRIGGEPGS